MKMAIITGLAMSILCALSLSPNESAAMGAAVGAVTLIVLA